ncbi:RNA 2',3'-cyclic phosphodiesterase [Telluria aromaticivorans]|uniref:RNA 2',3'-cyclic phosphodiesterase n=1 Tax=Telluria aromaticivorans TaxID=2725995 RepID=A0A7Y2K254_9BURK|nr:RNA 2',3'-cyclic phosphodiesterase [Telluria aromaticivorans]NNG25176.1 RNA 2',3'-cyclic phosphodiesterase [Telluria aromaticivorans]
MDRQPTNRLFLALWPDPAMRHLLKEWRDAWGWVKGATPVAFDKLHVTLHFLGGLPGERLQEFLDGFSVPFEPFRLELATPAVWHNGIAVLEPEQAPPALLALHARLAESLVALGLHPESRPYRPHVTMARRATGAAMPAGLPPVSWDVRGYALVESKNSVYTVLRAYS